MNQAEYEKEKRLRKLRRDTAGQIFEDSKENHKGICYSEKETVALKRYLASQLYLRLLYHDSDFNNHYLIIEKAKND